MRSTGPHRRKDSNNFCDPCLAATREAASWTDGSNAHTMSTQPGSRQPQKSSIACLNGPVVLGRTVSASCWARSFSMHTRSLHPATGSGLCKDAHRVACANVHVCSLASTCGNACGGDKQYAVPALSFVPGVLPAAQHGVTSLRHRPVRAANYLGPARVARCREQIRTVFELALGVYRRPSAHLPAENLLDACLASHQPLHHTCPVSAQTS